MIKIKNLKKYYGKELVIDDVSLEINKGEIYAIVGHSGAGKSTLLRCINGLEDYQKGSLKVLDEEIKELKQKYPKKLRILRKDIGMIFQNFALMERKNIFENVAMPLRTHFSQCKIYSKIFNKEYMSEKEINEKVHSLLEIVGLNHKFNSYPKELSGGQKQRVAIARALTLNPKILLSDEATSALDPNTTKNILELISKINTEFGITVVLVTHEMDVVKDIAQKALLLEQGKIIGSGAIDELFLKPNQKMREFLGESDFLPTHGLNIKLYFPKEVVENTVITHMARTLDIDFNIVWGKIEKLNGKALGNLVINIDHKDRDKVLSYIEKNGVLWEFAS
ncbi:methionine ABC transporter ATP-binding protein [Campylobacter molothri]|uniref:methionine ABC transporter ATP-binding protein n=1 Tax=Campylobacter molothri TaxID=1032242 RepID=UPI0035AF79AB